MLLPAILLLLTLYLLSDLMLFSVMYSFASALLLVLLMLSILAAHWHGSGMAKGHVEVGYFMYF